MPGAPFHYERPIFPLLLKQLLQKQRYTTVQGTAGLKHHMKEPALNVCPITTSSLRERIRHTGEIH
jgi:hypothetical protein